LPIALTAARRKLGFLDAAAFINLAAFPFSPHFAIFSYVTPNIPNINTTPVILLHILRGIISLLADKLQKMNG